MNPKQFSYSHIQASPPLKCRYAYKVCSRRSFGTVPHVGILSHWNNIRDGPKCGTIHTQIIWTSVSESISFWSIGKHFATRWFCCYFAMRTKMGGKFGKKKHKHISFPNLCHCWLWPRCKCYKFKLQCYITITMLNYNFTSVLPCLHRIKSLSGKNL